jgi:uncharacterized Rmd1/YagE family protein
MRLSNNRKVAPLQQEFISQEVLKIQTFAVLLDLGISNALPAGIYLSQSETRMKETMNSSTKPI